MERKERKDERNTRNQNITKRQQRNITRNPRKISRKRSDQINTLFKKFRKN